MRPHCAAIFHYWSEGRFLQKGHWNLSRMIKECLMAFCFTEYRLCYWHEYQNQALCYWLEYWNQAVCYWHEYWDQALVLLAWVLRSSSCVIGLSTEIKLLCYWHEYWDQALVLLVWVLKSSSCVIGLSTEIKLLCCWSEYWNLSWGPSYLLSVSTNMIANPSYLHHLTSCIHCGCNFEQ